MALNRLASDGMDFTVTKWNDDADKLENFHVTSVGRGIVNGLTMTSPGADTVRIADGALISRSYVALTGIADFTVPNGATTYLWISETAGAAIVQTGTAVYPGGNVVCLGAAINTAHTVTFDLTQRDVCWHATTRGSWQIGQQTLTIDSINNRIGLNINAPTALLHLGAGQAGVSTAMMKLTSGVLLTALEANALEYDGTTLFLIHSDGTTREPVTRGRYTTIALTNVNVTLVPGQYGGRVINLTGNLTGNVNIIFPLFAGMDWIVDDQTVHGGFTITAKGASGTGVTTANGRNRIYTDGTNFLSW